MGSDRRGIKPWHRKLQERLGLKPQIKVRIISCKNPYFWYSKFVGKEFDIQSINESHFVTFRTSNQGFGIGREDAEIVVLS